MITCAYSLKRLKRKMSVDSPQSSSGCHLLASPIPPVFRAFSLFSMNTENLLHSLATLYNFQRFYVETSLFSHLIWLRTGLKLNHDLKVLPLAQTSVTDHHLGKCRICRKCEESYYNYYKSENVQRKCGFLTDVLSNWSTGSMRRAV